MTKRKTIGRTLHTGPLLDNAPAPVNEQFFTLSSGNKVPFKLQHLAAGAVARQSYVDMATNGRDQSALTQASVADICRTLSLQQFFPAIGCLRPDGRIEILDGSRRRAAALFVGVGLDILVTKADIGIDDARQLARDIQTAREHNLREVGIRLLMLRDSGLNQKEIAQTQGMSAAKVTRAIQAALVPASLLALFPVQAELTYPDYKSLLTITQQLAEKSLELTLLNDKSHKDKGQLDTLMPAEQYKDALLKIIAVNAEHLLQNNTKKPKQKIQKLWTFTDKDTFARRKEKERAVSYEFNRLPKNVITALDEAINAVLKKNFS